MNIAVRRNRTRYKMKMNSKLPRVSVNKSNKYFTAQLIDAHADGKVMLSMHQKTFVAKNAQKGKTPVEVIEAMGESFAKDVIKLGIMKVVFDRSGYIFHGKVKAFAEGMRKAGLIL